MFGSFFGFSRMTKFTMLLGASALVLFGIGYVIQSASNLVEELSSNEDKVKNLVEDKVNLFDFDTSCDTEDKLSDSESDTDVE